MTPPTFYVWLKPYKKPVDLIWKPSGGYSNDYSTDSLLEGMVNELSWELINRIFGETNTSFIDQTNHSFDLAQPTGISDGEKASFLNPFSLKKIPDFKESQAAAGLIYDSMHGFPVMTHGNAEIPVLDIANGQSIYSLGFHNNPAKLKDFIDMIKKYKPVTLYDLRCSLKKYLALGKNEKNELGLDGLDQIFIRHGVSFDRDGDWQFNPYTNEKKTIGKSSNKDSFLNSNDVEIGPRNWRK